MDGREEKEGDDASTTGGVRAKEKNLDTEREGASREEEAGGARKDREDERINGSRGKVSLYGLRPPAPV